MKGPWLRLVVGAVIGAIIIIAGGVLWIWKTLYPRPLPSQPWQVPNIQMPSGPPTPALKEEMEKRLEGEKRTSGRDSGERAGGSSSQKGQENPADRSSPSSPTGGR
ncbi:MAG: hypothetical protein NZ959_06160 [Armatimonadetes bacterium]|nr:hypothetical protein [Armatimonadota bacterium]MDW8121627.1 hypothetical protein [Armatimonadota bacterium]